MPAGTVAIVLIAAIAHAIWNTASKCKRGDPLLFVWAYTCGATLLCMPFGVVPMITGAQPLSWQFAVASVVSAVLHVVYSLVLQLGYERFDLGVIYPVARGTGPILTMLSAILLLGERPAWTALLGAAVIVAGIMVVAGDPFRYALRSVRGGVLWGTATGASIAAYTLWDGYAVTSLGLLPSSYFFGAFLLQSLLLTAGALRKRSRIPTTIRSNMMLILIVAVLSPLAYVLVLTAMQTAPIALVAPLRESAIVIGSLIAWRLFHEQDLVRRLIGAGIVLCGVVTISL